MRDLLHTLRLIIGRGRITRTAWGKSPRSVQVRMPDGAVLDGVHVIGQAGVISRPRAGAEVVVVCAGGDRSHPIVIGTLDREHPGPDLEEGEAAIFAAGGAIIHCKLDGTVAITGDVRVTGSVIAEGGIADAEGTLAELRTTFETHIHSTPVGPTGPPTQ